MLKEAEILKQIIQSRRSIYPRDYSGEDIPEETLKEITSAAGFAPSHKKTQPWRFRVFEKKAKNTLAKALQQAYRNSVAPEHFLEKKFKDIENKILASGAVISVSVNYSGLVPEWEEVAATAMAVQNMYLMCTALGIGCYWSTPNYTNHLSGFLSLNENQNCLGLFYLGRRRN